MSEPRGRRRDACLRTLRRGALVACLIAVAASPLAGCDADLELLNSAPRVTWTAVEPLTPGTHRVTIWVSDVEGDSVDVSAWWVDEAGAATPIRQRIGSHGLIGLPTRDALLDPNGQPHEVLWDTSDVTGTVRLRFTPDDRPREPGEGVGETVETPAFSVEVGLPEPELVTPVVR